MVIKSFFEIDNKNTITYDGLHRYCIIEHERLNEAYLRTSVKKRRFTFIRILQGILGSRIKRKRYACEKRAKSEMIIGKL